MKTNIADFTNIEVLFLHNIENLQWWLGVSFIYITLSIFHETQVKFLVRTSDFPFELIRVQLIAQF